MAQPPAPRRAKHLIDPTQPRVAATAEEVRRLERVQRTVLSVLVFTTIIHLSVGLVIGALFIDRDQVVARVGLCVLGALTGVLSVAAARAIHRREPASWWLLPGVLPGVVGLVLVLR